MFCITVWACPAPNSAIANGTAKPSIFAVGDWLRLGTDKYLKSLQVVKLYLFTTGTWQYWDMFAPNPADTDIYADSLVHYKNGQVRLYQYPRMFLLGIPQKYVMERYRKFLERAHDESKTYMYSPFLYREASECATDPNNPPVRLDLRVHSKRITPPGTPEPTQYDTVTYFIGEVDPVRLQKTIRQMRSWSP